MNSEQQKTELSLWDLCLICFQAIGRFFSWLWKLCTDTLRLSLQLWYIVLPIVILGIAGGLYFSRQENRIYKVGTMVHLAGVNRTDVQNVYNTLSLATPDFINASQSLTTQLGLSHEQARALRKFEIFNVLDYCHDSVPDMVDKKNKHDLADTVTVVMPNYVYLSFQTKRPQEAQQVGAAIINYLNSNATLQKEHAAYKQVIQRKADFCQTQIEKLDSLTTAFYFEQAGSGQIQHNRWSSALVVGERSIELFLNEILYFIQDNEFAQKQLTMASAPVVPMSEWIVNPRAVNGRLKCLVLGALLGYLLGCGFAAAWRQRKRFAQWVKSE